MLTANFSNINLGTCCESNSKQYHLSTSPGVLEVTPNAFDADLVRDP